MTPRTYRDHLALGGHEGGPVAESQLGLQGVEVDLQLALLLDLGTRNGVRGQHLRTTTRDRYTVQSVLNERLDAIGRTVHNYIYYCFRFTVFGRDAPK